MFPYIPFLHDFVFDAVVLANGDYPTHPIPLKILHKAERIVCCDGAADKLFEWGIEPWAIVGDLDSLQENYKADFKEQLVQVDDQETNDLTKAVDFCHKNKLTNICILGATGKREDHTLANIALLADYAKFVKVQMYTNTGVFTPILTSSEFESAKGQQVSVFSLTPVAPVTSEGLRYPLQGLQLQSWWQGSLNEAVGTSFKLHFNEGKLLVYREYTA